MKPIVLSNLMMRFYRVDGWTKGELDSCCERGEVKCFFPNDPLPYFTLVTGAYFNLDKLLSLGYVSNPHKYDTGLVTDYEILQGYNG